MEKRVNFTFYGGFCTMAKERGLDCAAAWAQGKGFRSVEFYEEAAGAQKSLIGSLAEARAVKERLAEYGLTTACYSLLGCLYGEGADENEAFLMKQAEFAAELGSPFLHHTLLWWLQLPPNAPTYEEAFEEVLDRATRVAKRCEGLGITCLYEEQGLYFNGVNGFGRFFKEMKKRQPNVGVCGDMGNILFVDETPDLFFEAFKKDIKHVHLKDYFLKTPPQPSCDGVWYPTAGGNLLCDCKLGEGVVPFEKCISALKSAGYDGAYSFELSRLDHFDDGIAFAQKVLG